MSSLKTRWILLAALAMTVAACAGPAVSEDVGEVAVSDEEAVRSAAAQFYAALNTMFTGDVGPMTQVWSHAADVTYMGPGGGLEIGWDAVLGDWQAQAAMKLGGRVEAVDMRVIVGRDIAVTHNYEKGENVNAAGEPQTVSIRATNVFRREGGAWKMIGHHTDLLPYLQ